MLGDLDPRYREAPVSAAQVPVGVAAPPRLSGGVGYWVRSLRLMMRFDWGRARQWAPMIAVIQLFMGAGMAIMYGFFYPSISPTTAMMIATGTPTLALIPLGFVMVPGGVSQQRTEGTFDFIWSLPAPRSAQVMSTFTLYAVLSLPGTLLAMLVAVARYDVHLKVSAAILLAVAMSALVSVTIGFGMALAIRSAVAVNLIANAIVFLVLLFSPIVYPMADLPAWYQRVQHLMPFYNMAVVIRAGLTDGVVTSVLGSYMVLAAWGILGCALTAWVVGRRR
jgi:ABC-2 type transport system permease protein